MADCGQHTKTIHSTTITSTTSTTHGTNTASTAPVMHIDLNDILQKVNRPIIIPEGRPPSPVAIRTS